MNATKNKYTGAKKHKNCKGFPALVVNIGGINNAAVKNVITDHIFNPLVK